MKAMESPLSNCKGEKDIARASLNIALEAKEYTITLQLTKNAHTTRTLRLEPRIGRTDTLLFGDSDL